MTKEYTKYIIEAKVKSMPGESFEWTWAKYDTTEWDNLEDAIEEIEFYRDVPKAHEFRIIKRNYIVEYIQMEA